MTRPSSVERMLTVEDVANLTRLSRKRILKAVRDGELTGARFGNRIRFRPDAVRTWLERAEGGER